MKERILNAFRYVFRIGMGTWRQMRKADVPVLAGSLSFATVLSIVPLLAVSLSVFKAFGGFENLYREIEPFILKYFVETSGAHVSKFIEESIRRIQSGALGTLGAIALFITSTKLFLDVEKAVQTVWQEKPSRFKFRRLIVYWTVMFAGPLVLAVALGIIGSQNMGILPLLPHHLITLVCTFIGFLAINRYLPARTVSWSSAIRASLWAAIGIVATQAFYARLTHEFLRYSTIYGSIASIPIFFLWILILWWICLGGVALCATLERERNGEPLN